MLITDVKLTQSTMLKQFIEDNHIAPDVALSVLAEGTPAMNTSRPMSIDFASYKAQVWAWHLAGVSQTEIARRTGRKQPGISLLLKRMKEFNDKTNQHQGVRAYR